LRPEKHLALTTEAYLGGVPLEMWEMKKFTVELRTRMRSILLAPFAQRTNVITGAL
jgi:hypothetical protein